MCLILVVSLAVPAAGAGARAGTLTPPDGKFVYHPTSGGDSSWKPPVPLRPFGQGIGALQAGSEGPPPAPTLTVEVSGDPVVPVGATSLRQVRVLSGTEPVGGAHVAVHALWWLPWGIPGSSQEGPASEVGMTDDQGYLTIALSPAYPGMYVITAYGPPETEGEPGPWGLANLYALPSDGTLGAVRLGFTGLDQLPTDFAGFKLPSWVTVVLPQPGGPPVWQVWSQYTPGLLLPAASPGGDGSLQPVVMLYNVWDGGGIDYGWDPAVSLFMMTAVPRPAGGQVETVSVDLSSQLRRIDVLLDSSAYAEGRVFLRPVIPDAGPEGPPYLDTTLVPDGDGKLNRQFYVTSGPPWDIMVMADGMPSDGGVAPDDLLLRQEDVGFAGGSAIAPVTFGTNTAGLYRLNLSAVGAEGVTPRVQYGVEYDGAWCQFETAGESLYLTPPGAAESVYLRYVEAGAADAQGTEWRYDWGYRNLAVPEGDDPEALGFSDGVATVAVGAPPLQHRYGPGLHLGPEPYVPVNGGAGYQPGDRVGVKCDFWGISDNNGNELWHFGPRDAQGNVPPDWRPGWQLRVEKQDGTTWIDVFSEQVQPSGDPWAPWVWQIPPDPTAAGHYRLTAVVDMGPLLGEVEFVRETEVAVPPEGGFTMVNVVPESEYHPVRVGDDFSLSVWAHKVPGNVYRGLSGIDVTMPFPTSVVDVTGWTDVWHDPKTGQDVRWFPGHWVGTDEQGNELLDGGTPIIPEVSYPEPGTGLFRFVRFLVGDEPTVFGSGMLVRIDLEAKGSTGKPVPLYAGPPSDIDPPPIAVTLEGWDLTVDDVYQQPFDIGYISPPSSLEIAPALLPVSILSPASAPGPVYIPSPWFPVGGTGNPDCETSVEVNVPGQPPWFAHGWSNEDGMWEVGLKGDLPDGSYLLTAHQRDRWGGEVSSDPVHVIVDTRRPHLVIDPPVPAGDTIAISGRVDDPNLRDVYVFLDAAPGSTYTESDLPTQPSEEGGCVRRLQLDSQGGFSLSVPATTGEVLMLARDLAGHHACTSVFQAAAPPPPGGSISGRVTDEQGNPIAGADVWAEPYEGGPGVGGAKTDGNGYYTIIGLPSGQYRVGAKAPGRVMCFYDNTLMHHEADPVTVVAPNDTPNINFALEPGGTISGTVRGPGGQPLSGVSVECMRTDEPGGAGAVTREDGTYTLDGLPFGTYQVSAPSGDRWGPNDGDWAREWYQEKTVSPTPVVLSESSPYKSGIDFTLEPGGSIAGTVTDADGPMAGVNVWATYFDGPSDFVIAGTRTGGDGTYVLKNLPVGKNYRVQAYAEGYRPQWYNNATDYAQATPVTVGTPTTIVGIDFALTPREGLYLEVTGVLFPNDSTADVPTNTRMVVWFTGTPGRDVNAALQNGIKAFVTPEGGEPVGVEVANFGGDGDGKAAILIPVSELAANTAYTLAITGKEGADPPVDVAPHTVNFATGSGPDNAPPSLQAVVPAVETGVSVNTAVALTFSEVLNPLSSSMSLYEGTEVGTNPVSAGSGFSGKDFTTVHLWLDGALKPGTTYTWAARVEDLCGNRAGTPEAPLTGSFSTAPAGDTQAPVVTATEPQDGETGVGTGTNVVITFSEPMKTGAAFTFSLRAQGATSDVPGTGTWNANRTTYAFNPTGDLQYNTLYNVSFSGEDDAGNAMTDSFSFTTVPPPATETVAPSILPAQQTLGVGASGTVRVHLDGVTAQMNLTAATVELKYDPGKLRVTSFETGALLSGGIPVGPNHDATTGTIVFSISRPTSPATGPGDLLLIHFQTLQEGATEFRFFDVTGQSGGDGIEVINASDQEILTSIPSNAQINVISGGTLSGRVLLQGRYNQSTMQLIRDHSGIKIEVLGAGIDPVYTQADGTFSVVLPAGTYPVMISRSQYLRQLVQVTITAGATTDLSTAVGHDVILLAGDIDGDAYNRVYTSDLQALARAFGSNSTTQTGNWNAAADLDGNGAVYTSDLQLLARNFGKRGDAYPAP